MNLLSRVGSAAELACEYVILLSHMHPCFKDIYETDVRVNKEILPHGIMAAYADYLCKDFEMNGPNNFTQEVFDSVEIHLKFSIEGGNSPLESLIVASFIFNASSSAYKGKSITDMMGSISKSFGLRYL